MPDTFDKLTNESTEIPTPVTIKSSIPLEAQALAPEYETVANLFGVSDGSYDFTIDLDSAKSIDFQIAVIINDSPAVVEFKFYMNQIESLFIDVTEDLYGAAVLSTADLGDTFEKFLIDNGNLTKAARSIKVNVSISGGADDVDYSIGSKKNF